MHRQERRREHKVDVVITGTFGLSDSVSLFSCMSFISINLAREALSGRGSRGRFRGIASWKCLRRPGPAGSNIRYHRTIIVYHTELSLVMVTIGHRHR